MQGLKEDERAVQQLLQTLENDLRVSNDTIAAFREVGATMAVRQTLAFSIDDVSIPE